MHYMTWPDDTHCHTPTQRKNKVRSLSSMIARLSSRHNLRLKTNMTRLTIIACDMSLAHQENQMMKTMTKPQNYATMETY